MVNHSKGLIAASRNSEVKDTLKEIAEITLDDLMSTINNNEHLKDIPLIGSAIAVVKGFSAINNAHTLRKFANFIGVINELNETEAEQLQTHLSNVKNQKKIIEETILFIDRYHNELKARLLGQLFKETFLCKSFTADEYNSLLFSIEQIHPYLGLNQLKEYYDLAIEEETANGERVDDIRDKQSQIDYQQLVSTGFLEFPLGQRKVGERNGGKISKLGRRFYENVVLKTDLTELNLTNLLRSVGLWFF